MGRSIEALITDDTSGKCVGIISNGLRINCQKLVMGGRTCPTDLKEVGYIMVRCKRDKYNFNILLYNFVDIQPVLLRGFTCTYDY